MCKNLIYKYLEKLILLQIANFMHGFSVYEKCTNRGHPERSIAESKGRSTIATCTLFRQTFQFTNQSAICALFLLLKNRKTLGLSSPLFFLLLRVQKHPLPRQ